MLEWMERMERVRDGRRGAFLDGWREWRERSLLGCRDRGRRKGWITGSMFGWREGISTFRFRKRDMDGGRKLV